MSDIFEEVEEEVRKDRLSELWRRYGIIVWILAGVIVLGVAYNEYSQSRQAQEREALIETFEAASVAMDAGDFQAAADGFQALVESDTRLSPMAAHLLAQARIAGDGDRAMAAGILTRAEGDGEAAFEKLAILKQAYLRSGEMSLEETEALLSELAAQETPFGALASEVIAAKAFEAGETERARQMLNRLRFAAYAPSGLTQRAQIALDAMPRPSAQPASALPGAPPAGEMQDAPDGAGDVNTNEESQ